jgi:hypothetical protein
VCQLWLIFSAEELMQTHNLEKYIQYHKMTCEIPNFLDDEQLMQQQSFLKLDHLTTTGYPKQHHHISHIKICLKKETNK